MSLDLSKKLRNLVEIYNVNFTETGDASIRSNTYWLYYVLSNGRYIQRSI